MLEYAKKVSWAFVPMCAVCMLILLSIAGAAEKPGASPGTGPGISMDKFAPMVGVWRAEVEAGRPVLKVDGSAWKRGQAAPELEKSSRAIFGDGAAGFAKMVASAANFPFAVFTGMKNFQGGEL